MAQGSPYQLVFSDPVNREDQCTMIVDSSWHMYVAHGAIHTNYMHQYSTEACKVTLRIGLFRPEAEDDLTDLVSNIDQACYTADNKTICSSGSPSGSSSDAPPPERQQHSPTAHAQGSHHNQRQPRPGQARPAVHHVSMRQRCELAHYIRIHATNCTP